MNKITAFNKDDYATCLQDWTTESGVEKGKGNELPYNALRLGLVYKRRVRDLHEKLDGFKRSMNRVQQMWVVLGPKFVRKPVEVVPIKVPKYKVVKGDRVDELMAEHLRKNNCNLKVVRTGPGKYMFGTKSIMAKVINDKLVIRVGGGYMGADEFIQTYGPMEMAKVLEASG